MVQMKQSAAGSADMGMMEDLQLAVSLHRLDDVLTVPWATQLSSNKLGKSRKILANPQISSKPDFIQIIKRYLLARQISMDSVR